MKIKEKIIFDVDLLLQWSWFVKVGVSTKHMIKIIVIIGREEKF